MKIADPKPPYCAACFAAPHDKRCIDFEAAYDGPVIPGSPTNVPVDDLIICEDCLGAAFALIDPQGLQLEIDRLESELQIATDEAEARRRSITYLEQHRENKKHKLNRKKVSA